MVNLLQYFSTEFQIGRPRREGLGLMVVAESERVSYASLLLYA